jgi:hypothetical protein
MKMLDRNTGNEQINMNRHMCLLASFITFLAMLLGYNQFHERVLIGYSRVCPGYYSTKYSETTCGS